MVDDDGYITAFFTPTLGRGGASAAAAAAITAAAAGTNSQQQQQVAAANGSTYSRLQGGSSGGVSVRARVLVGCDGYFSRVRRQCLNDGPPVVSLRATC
jgi:2-polyprenyl-6-methoxyphenol hydroxylase-like FAD-dependent oxidoreductase